MRHRTFLATCALLSLAIAAFILVMASAGAREHDRQGPRDYASPGHHYGVEHGRGGPPDKTP